LLLPGAAPEEHDLHRVEGDQEIHKQRHVLDVVEVVLEFFQGIFLCGSVRILDLGPAGNPGFTANLSM